jgi:hypothetical protein
MFHVEALVADAAPIQENNVLVVFVEKRAARRQIMVCGHGREVYGVGQRRTRKELIEMKKMSWTIQI